MMIETEEQRRWWFATHPEYSWSRTGQRGRKPREERDGPDKVSPDEVDAYVDEARKYATGTVHDFLGIIKKWFGTEGEGRESNQPGTPGWAAEARGSGGSTATSRPEDDPSYWEGYREARRLIWNKEPIPPYDPDDDSPYRQGFGRGVLQAYREAEAAARLWEVFQNTWDTLTSWLPFVGGTGGARLPPEGTPERARIEAARQRGIRAKKAEELENIRAGGRGSGVWTETELEVIRRTGEFPPDAQWHHNPTVANCPDRAADPRAVHPVRGGRKGHLRDGHKGNWRNPRQ